MNKNKILTIGGAMVIIAVVLLTAFFGNPGGETKNQPSKPTHVRAVPASIEPITEILELTGFGGAAAGCPSDITSRGTGGESSCPRG